jgi:hypothetical protein
MIVTLGEAASVLRSKNSGPFAVTLDVIFENPDIYCAVKNNGVLTRRLVADLYHLTIDEVSDVIYFDRALGIKITIARRISSGSMFDTDVYGAQQAAPLSAIVIGGVGESLR